jgi:hypothetical protein
LKAWALSWWSGRRQIVWLGLLEHNAAHKSICDSIDCRRILFSSDARQLLITSLRYRKNLSWLSWWGWFGPCTPLILAIGFRTSVCRPAISSPGLLTNCSPSPTARRARERQRREGHTTAQKYLRALRLAPAEVALNAHARGAPAAAAEGHGTVQLSICAPPPRSLSPRPATMAAAAPAALARSRGGNAVEHDAIAGAVESRPMGCHDQSCEPVQPRRGPAD